MNKGDVKALRDIVHATEGRAEAYEELGKPDAKNASLWVSYQILSFLESRKKAK